MIDTDLMIKVLDRCVRHASPFTDSEATPGQVRAAQQWIELMVLAPLIGLREAQGEDVTALVLRITQLEVQIEDLDEVEQLADFAERTCEIVEDRPLRTTCPLCENLSIKNNECEACGFSRNQR